MSGSRSKEIRREMKKLKADEAELKYCERQAKAGQRYIEFFNEENYQQVYVDRLTGERYVGAMPRQLKAVKL